MSGGDRLNFCSIGNVPHFDSPVVSYTDKWFSINSVQISYNVIVSWIDCEDFLSPRHILTWSAWAVAKTSLPSAAILQQGKIAASPDAIWGSKCRQVTILQSSNEQFRPNEVDPNTKGLVFFPRGTRSICKYFDCGQLNCHKALLCRNPRHLSIYPFHHLKSLLINNKTF